MREAEVRPAPKRADLGGPALLQTVALSNLRLAPENARKACRADVRALAKSISAEGLIDPLHAYRVGKLALIWDGGRRLKALQLLAKLKQLPEPLRRGVPVLCSEASQARRRSLVTFYREDMHPAQEFRAYKALFDEGEKPDRIAAALGGDARRVAQLLKLVNLAPEVLAAFEAGEFGLDTAQAFTLTDDQAKQRAVMEACRAWISAARVRQMLRSDMASPQDRLSRFVGREAYEAAGGGFLTDLFTDGPDAELWTDSGLVERLAAEKLEAAVAELRAEGWAWVTVVDPYDYGWSLGFDPVSAERATLSEVEQAEYDEGAAVLEDEGASDDERDAAEATLARLDACSIAASYTAEQKAQAGVFVQVDVSGSLRVHRGYVRRARAHATGADGDTRAPDIGLTGWGHTGHWHLTQVATAAARHALLKDPSAAYDVLVAGLAWEVAGRSAGGALKLDPRGVEPRSIPSEARLDGEETWEAQRSAWRERIPAESFEACFDFVVALADEAKAEIVALAVGLSLDAVETRFDQRRPLAWDQLACFARRVHLDVRSAWRAGQSFLAKGSKAALLEALAETGGATGFERAKKAELISELERRMPTTDWQPPLLRSLSAERG